ncbi:unnamed protein product, partial [Ectocarpus sp. 8 AP-2014]
GGLFRKNSKFADADADVDAAVDVSVPAIEGGVSAEMPTVGGDGTLPPADVSLPSASVDASGALKGPDAPDVKVEGGSLTGKLTAGAASVGAAALGAIGLYGRS